MIATWFSCSPVSSSLRGLQHSAIAVNGTVQNFISLKNCFRQISWSDEDLESVKQNTNQSVIPAECAFVLRWKNQRSAETFSTTCRSSTRWWRWSSRAIYVGDEILKIRYIYIIENSTRLLVYLPLMYLNYCNFNQPSFSMNVTRNEPGALILIAL